MPTWLHFGSQNPLKSRLGSLLGRLESVLEMSWAILGASWSILSRLGGLGLSPGASCKRLGGFLVCLGRVLGRLEVSWGSLGLDFPSPKEPN